jgi:hypothetical protein
VSIASFAYDKDERAAIEIDRRGIAVNSQEALEKSREFIRRDSTYYIGWMLWGAYLYERANDEKGFSQAIEPLQRAFDLIERDYDTELRTRSNDFTTYIKVNYIHNDYAQIANWLSGAYQNIEKAQNAYDVLWSFKNHDLQFESVMDSWNTLAWLYHRNRMYTSEKFPFLSNSVEANDSIAYDCLDSAIAKTQRDMEMNIGLYDATFLNSRFYYTYHYKVILFTYDFQLDSADYYYNILLESGYYSSNNYANYMYMKAEFNIAEQFYLEAEQRDNTTDKHTREYYYMRGLLEVNRATPQRSDSLLDAIIDNDGPTPGYGWHNIALARSMLYEGLTAQAQRKVNIAARFQELHIGTTWGQEQYNLSVAMLNYMNQLHFENEYYFENDNWYFWLNPYNWYKSIEFKVKLHHFRLMLIELVAANPERAQVIYPLFSSENLLSWDEAWQMLDGFSNRYFIRMYEDMLENDERYGVRNYIRFTLARLYMSDGDDTKALEYLDEIYYQISNERMDFDNLLYARVCEAYAQIYGGEEGQEWLREAYNTFPQMIPHSGETLDFHVRIDGQDFQPGARDSFFRFSVFLLIGTVLLTGLFVAMKKYFGIQRKAKWVYLSATVIAVGCCIVILVNILAMNALSDKEEIIASLAKCDIGFTSDPDAPLAEFEFMETDSTMDVRITVTDSDDRIVNEGAYSVDPDYNDFAGVVLAYRMFNIDFSSSNEPVEAEESTLNADD